MIASTPVARWTWGRSDDSGDDLALCLRDALAAHSVLAAHGLATAEAQVRLSVAERGRPQNSLFRGELRTSDDSGRFSETVRAHLGDHPVGPVDANLRCDGMLASTEGDTLQCGLFELRASAYAGFVSVELVTLHDSWMPYDLKGRAQGAGYPVNAARLAAALPALADALHSETDPDNQSHFARPTTTGADNVYEEGGTPSDVWATFEIPRRYDEFTHAPGFGRIGYKRTAEGEVQYVPVLVGHAVLGYLWASDAENAASFEPKDVGDDETYHAGLHWLDRLHTAHDQGLAPSEALQQLTDGLPQGDHAPGRMRLGALREMAADL
ncbi:hypothetical protein ACFUJY_15455 [Streptomyces sp. NPDC057249]|uniref:hypothetical protein n=1 Tax=Streptomyces sp. NPDC057249 TaxID=3346067 RepID=UPI00362D498C